ncbi:carboxymuconolactone decarboxylase family protein [Mucilaginibacter lutimaris]|uniref:Carboxymuconolactone decarboxylase family protein n=1 Tax=Mucilaginibacter lutimaris TaxID=931629 RepID=A0ABW2ZKK3_9SPHI
MQKSPDNPMLLFAQEAPEVANAFDALIQSIVASKGLDTKTKQLLYIALKAAEGDQVAVGWHSAMAKAAGAKKAEVVDAILLTLTVRGIRGVASCLPTALKAFETE